MKLLKLSLSAAAALSSFATAGGAYTDPLLVTVEKSQNIQAPRALTPTAVLSSSYIEDSGATTLTELLESSGVVSITQNYSGSKHGGVVSMRGFGENSASNILVLVDGVPLSNPTLQSANLSLINIAQIKRVEIFRGSASVLFGAGAVGGAVNIITYGYDVSKLQLDAGSFGHKAINLTHSAEINSRLALRVDASSQTSNGFRANSREENKNFAVTTDYLGSATSARLKYLSSTNDKRDPGALSSSDYSTDRFSSTTPDDYTNIDTQLAQLIINSRLAENLASDFSVESRRQGKDGYLYGALIEQLNTARVEARLRGNSNLVGNGEHWTLGASNRVTSLTGNNALGSTDSSRRVIALYASNSLQLSDQLSVDLGYRNEKIKEADKITDTDYRDSLNMAEFGMRYQLGPDLSAFARLDRGGRFSTIDENAYTPSSIDFLAPQKSRSIEFGMTSELERATTNFSLFKLMLEDEIYYDAASGSGENVNLDSSERMGAQLNGSLAVSPQLTLGYGFTYTQSKLTAGSNIGKEVPYVPNWEGKLSAKYRLNDSWLMEANYLYIGERYFAGDDSNSLSKVPANRQLDLMFGYQQRGLSLKAGVKNLLDADNIAFAGNGWAGLYYYAATPRALSVTLTYNF